jgi:hypothetical protein
METAIRPFLVALAAAILFLCDFASETIADSPVIDHLVPVEKEYGLGAVYEKLWTEKLLVTPGDTARFVFLPGNVGEESAVSVYRKEKGGNTGYWVTVTQPSRRLWNCVPQVGSEPRTDLRAITVDRCNLPLPESTALAVRRVWLAMLIRARPDPRQESISLDNSTEIFSASDAHGKLLRAQMPTGHIQQNNSALLDIANLLIEYCNIPESRQVDKARQIESAASALLKRISRAPNPRNSADGMTSSREVK